MIDKITAGILYSYGYKLKDSEGNVYDVVGARQNWIHLNKNGLGDWRIKLIEIGTTYKILARPLEMLTKEIEHEGKKFVPVDYFEIGDDDSYMFEFDNGNIKLIKTLRQISEFNVKFDVQFLPAVVVNKLKEWHFNIGFPENTTTDLI